MHIQMHFCEWKAVYFDYNFKIVPKGPIDNNPAAARLDYKVFLSPSSVAMVQRVRFQSISWTLKLFSDALR